MTLLAKPGDRGRPNAPRGAISGVLGFAASLGVAGLLLSLSVAHATAIWPGLAKRVERGLTASALDERKSAVLGLAELPLVQRIRLLPRALLDESVEVRVAAAAIAVNTQPATHAPMFAQWLSAEQPELRLAAAQFFEATGLGALATGQLGRALADSSALVRQTAASALGACRSPDAVVALLGHMDDATPSVVQATIDALARLGDDRALGALATKLSDSRVEVRRNAVTAIARIGGPFAGAFLGGALRDSDPEVRSAAVWGLRFWGDTESEPGLVERLQTERSPDVRREIVQALVDRGTDSALAGLLPLLADVDRDGTRAVAIDALAEASPGVQAKLLSTLAARADEASLAVALATALARAGAAGLLPILDDLQARGVIERAQALELMAAVADPRSLPSVLEGLADASPAVRRTAGLATTRLLSSVGPDGRAVEPLVAALQAARSDSERLLLIRALGLTGSARAIEALLAFLPADSPVYRRALVVAVGEALGGALGATALAVRAPAEDFLLAALADADPGVAGAAGRALAQGGSLRSLYPLLESYRAASAKQRLTLLDALAGAARGATDRAAAESLVSQAELARGAARDTWVYVLSQLAEPEALWALTKLRPRLDRGSRAKLAEVLGAMPAARETVLELLDDDDERVQANAVWSLGAIGDARDQKRLEELMLGASPALAINATASWVRVAGRTGGAEAAPLCTALSHAEAYVRANAIAGLRLLGTECTEPAISVLLESDASVAVREQAARWLASGPAVVSRDLLRACQVRQVDRRVAEACAAPKALAPSPPAPLTFEVGDVEREGRERVATTLLLADGLRRVAVTDRRRRLWEPFAPAGKHRLEPVLSDVFSPAAAALSGVSP